MLILYTKLFAISIIENRPTYPDGDKLAAIKYLGSFPQWFFSFNRHDESIWQNCVPSGRTFHTSQHSMAQKCGLGLLKRNLAWMLILQLHLLDHSNGLYSNHLTSEGSFLFQHIWSWSRIEESNCFGNRLRQDRSEIIWLCKELYWTVIPWKKKNVHIPKKVQSQFLHSAVINY